MPSERERRSGGRPNGCPRRRTVASPAAPPYPRRPRGRFLADETVSLTGPGPRGLGPGAGRPPSRVEAVEERE